MNIPQSNLNNMLASISSLNHVLNETLTLHQFVESKCPDCSYDPVRGESTNPYCSTCGGVGKTIIDNATSIPSSVETYQDIVFEFKEVGRLEVGEILATIDKQEISQVLNANGKFNMQNQNDVRNFLDQYNEYEWNGSRYVMRSFQPNYLQGNFYEITVTLRLKAL